MTKNPQGTSHNTLWLLCQIWLITTLPLFLSHSGRWLFLGRFFPFYPLYLFPFRFLPIQISFFCFLLFCTEVAVSTVVALHNFCHFHHSCVIWLLFCQLKTGTCARLMHHCFHLSLPVVYLALWPCVCILIFCNGEWYSCHWVQGYDPSQHTFGGY